MTNRAVKLLSDMSRLATDERFIDNLGALLTDSTTLLELLQLWKDSKTPCINLYYIEKKCNI